METSATLTEKIKPMQNTRNDTRSQNFGTLLHWVNEQFERAQSILANRSHNDPNFASDLEEVSTTIGSSIMAMAKKGYRNAALQIVEQRYAGFERRYTL